MAVKFRGKVEPKVLPLIFRGGGLPPAVARHELGDHVPSTKSAQVFRRSRPIILAHELPSPLPPGDPVAIYNTPLVNVIETDTSYTLQPTDGILVATVAGLTLTLPDEPITTSSVLILADGGATNVTGGALRDQRTSARVVGSCYRRIAWIPDAQGMQS